MGSPAVLSKSVDAAARGGLLRLCLIALVLLAVPAGMARAQSETALDDPRGGISTLPEVVDARVTATPERARLIIDLTSTTEFAVVSIAAPDRIAVDVRSTGSLIGVPADVAGSGIVSSFAVELVEPGRVRTTLALAAAAQVQQAVMLDAVADQPARLVVDLISDTPENFAAKAAADLAASAAIQNVPIEAIAPPVEAGSTPADGSTVRPLIVIDPGHGGIDNGASAPNGVHEKNIVLAYALDLQKQLIDTGRYDVALTREDDTYLTLDQRVALARGNRADLFISLHADSFQQSEIRGASVFTRDEKASDILDKILAENENRADIVAGYIRPDIQPAVVDILVDLMRRETRKSSYIAAQALIQELAPSVALRRFPVRQADFFVLQAPEVPSVLIELGFLSNASDIANLQKPEFRTRMVEALGRGVDAYFKTINQQP